MTGGQVLNIQTMPASTCPQCGASFECRPQPDQRCWCLDLPPLPAPELGRNAAGCYCPQCLQKQLSACSLGHPGAEGKAAGPGVAP